MEEWLTVNQLVVGSIPTSPAKVALVAQLVEQETFNLKVTGSIPVERTTGLHRLVA